MMAEICHHKNLFYSDKILCLLLITIPCKNVEYAVMLAQFAFLLQFGKATIPVFRCYCFHGFWIPFLQIFPKTR